jgi:hypothetical protein
MKLLSIDSDAKTRKSNAKSNEWLTAIQYLAPADLAIPGRSVCPTAELAGCKEPCLNLSGRGVMQNVQYARLERTLLYFKDPDAYFDQLYNEVIKAETKAFNRGRMLALRLNGTSDIAWENTGILEDFPQVQFYDYTKLPTRRVPDNYHLTVSYSGANENYARKCLASRHNVAVVFRDELPLYWGGREVINGDDHDLRFLDKQGVIVGLKAKGLARKDTSGFVVDL